MQAIQVPSWGIAMMVVGVVVFIALVALYARRTRGLSRPLFSSPYTLWMIIFTIVPCFLIGYFAFTDANPSDLGFGRGTVNVDTLVYSLWMAFLCTIFCLFLGYPAAHIMADRDFKLGPTIVVLFIIPMWMNFLLRTIAWMTLLEDNGVINNFLEWIGIGRMQLMYNSQAVLLGMIYNFLPFMVFPIYNSLNKMDHRFSEAAMDLGANKWTTFQKVTLPLSLPGVISGITMVFMPSVTTFFIPRVLGGGNTEMFGDLIERMFLTADNWHVGSALSMIMMVLILLSLGLLRKVDPDGQGGSMI